MPDRFFLTTPIYYVNDAPHLGTAYSTVNADVLARWHRLIGDDSWFLTGTDEHGLKNARAAEEQGLTPQEWVDQTSRRYIASWAALDISNDDFIRTTEQRHHLSVQRFMQAIHDNGYMHKGLYEGWYCVSCEAYYPESDLLEGRVCPVHERPVEWLTEENWFFELSRFEQPLLDWYESHPHAIFPDSRRNEALGIIKGGLQDISITRTSIDWGVRVPWDGAHVFYVWYDALVNYITAIGYGEDPERFAKWWPAAHHLLGKDIIRFHCVWWPAMCLAAGIDPPAHYIVHGWLLVGGEKMSKTRLNQIDPVELAADIGVDALRYHLVRGRGAGLRRGLHLRRPDREVQLRPCEQSRQSARPGRGRRREQVRRDRSRSETCRAGCSAERGRGGGGDGVPGRLGNALRLTKLSRRRWRLVRAANSELETAEPWKLPPGPALDAALGDALEALRIVAVLVSPGDAGRRGRDLGTDRASGPARRAGRGRGERQPRVGGLPGEPQRHKGCAAVPAA